MLGNSRVHFVAFPLIIQANPPAVCRIPKIQFVPLPWKLQKLTYSQMTARETM
jgi:hypothetical protein